MKIVPVILAGGSGTRLWPLSRKSSPKQFLKLIGNHSLFQETLLRVKHISDVKEKLIVTSDSHYFICQDQMKELQAEDMKLILEPCCRNTAPAIALAAEEIIHTIDPHACMLVLPADHLIGQAEDFAEIVQSVLPLAQEGHFVTFGIVPSAPKTGYGYIKAGKSLSSLGYQVGQFVEKPDEKTAKEFIAQKNYFWNSGMFLFEAKSYLDELSQTAPKIYKTCHRAYQVSVSQNDYLRIDEKEFEACPEVSIDYAVMEKTARAIVAPLTLPWSDLGCWASVADAGDADEKDNVIRGNVIMKDCEGCLLSSESEPLVATIGIKDQIVVSTADAVLVASKDYAQEVKEIVNGLKNTNQRLTTHHKQIYRSWGHFETLVETDAFRIRLLVINKAHAYVSKQNCFVTIIRGKVEIEHANHKRELKKNTSDSFLEGETLLNQGEESVHLLEISISTHEDMPNPAVQTLESLLKQNVEVS